MADLNSDYRPSWVVNLLHSFPHFDLTFQAVNSTFNPSDRRYQESLLFWTALPVCCLLCILLLFLIYFCYRCCRRDAAHYRHVSCSKWCMTIIALLSCGVVGVGFYGNEEIKKEAVPVMSAANNSMEIMVQMQFQLKKLEASVNETVVSGVNGINSVYTGHKKLNAGVRHELIIQTKHSLLFAEEVLGFYYKNTAMQWIVSINTKDSWFKMFKEYTDYRWFSTTALLCWLILLCLMLLLAISKMSKCALLIFCKFAVFGLVKCWIAAGLHLGTSVAIADYCDSPHMATEELGSVYLDRSIIKYYMQCSPVNPIGQVLDSATEKIKEANDTLNKALDKAENLNLMSELENHVMQVYAGLGNATECILQLRELSKCTEPSRYYSTTVNVVCSSILHGLVLLTLSFAAAGLLFSLLVIMASRAWRSFGVREVEEAYPKPAGEANEDEGPFLPRPVGPAPVYHRYGAPVEYGRPGMVHDDFMPYSRGNYQVQLAMQRQPSPAPPPYSTTDFNRHYNDVVNPAMYGRCGHPAL